MQKKATMGLNIKNEKAHRLARELARVTGESMTVAVSKAIRERLERVRRVERIWKLDEIAPPSLRNHTNLWTMATCCTTKRVCRSDS